MPAEPLDPALAAALADQAGPVPDDLAAERLAYDEIAARHGGIPATVEIVADEPIADGLRARRYVPADAAAGTILYFHGGGWMVGTVASCDVAARVIANTARRQVISVDYRLAPEHPFPAAVSDGDALVAWVREHEDGPVAVAGDSAGANLATVCARHARGGVVAQALAYPVTAAPRPTRSYAERRGPLTLAEMQRLWDAYRGDAADDDPDVAPLHADLAAMPPTLIAVAGHDVLRDDGLQYAAALRAAGVTVAVEDYPSMAHGFLRFGGVTPVAGQLAGSIGRFLAGWC